VALRLLCASVVREPAAYVCINRNFVTKLYGDSVALDSSLNIQGREDVIIQLDARSKA
jgi:hypothetical protein